MQIGRCLENKKWAFIVLEALFASWALFGKWKLGVFCIKGAVCKLGAIRIKENGRFMYKRRCVQIGCCFENEKWAFIV